LALEGLPFTSIGLDNFDALAALEDWVERDNAPDKIMASGQNLDGDSITRPLFPYPLYPKYMGGDPADPDNFAADNDGSVRWKRFRKDTFYAFEIPELGIDLNPLVEGEGVKYFQPYDYKSLAPGTYDWRVWSPSMFEDVDYDGFNGQFEKE
jgi:hypothetical protein